MPFKNSEQAAAAGKLGGLKTKKRLETDPDYFVRIGTIGGRAIKDKYGKAYYARIGAMPRKEDIKP